MSRIDISSGSPWERAYSYSRAVRSGPLFQTSLTSPADENGKIVHLGSVYAQTKQCLTIIAKALEQASMQWSDVIATRVYMLDTHQWADAAKAHVEIVQPCQPALSFIGVANFFDPAILVEVEVTAWQQASEK